MIYCHIRGYTLWVAPAYLNPGWKTPSIIPICVSEVRRSSKQRWKSDICSSARFLSSLIGDMAVRTGIVGLLLVLVGLAFASAVSIGTHTPGPVVLVLCCWIRYPFQQLRQISVPRNILQWSARLMINPCLFVSCKAVGGASCVVDSCGECRPRWIMKGVDVTDQCLGKE